MPEDQEQAQASSFEELSHGKSQRQEKAARANQRAHGLPDRGRKHGSEEKEGQEQLSNSSRVERLVHQKDELNQGRRSWPRCIRLCL